jgi:zinc transporter 1/2/3
MAANDQESVYLRIIAIFAILVASVAGVALPFVIDGWYRRGHDSYGGGPATGHGKSKRRAVLILIAVGTGVMLATAMLHVMPEASEALLEGMGLDAETLAKARLADGERGQPHAAYPFGELIAMSYVLFLYIVEKELALALGRRASGTAPADAVGTTADASPLLPDNRGDGCDDAARNAAVSAHVLEVGVAVHSIVVGVAIGLETKPSVLRTLIAALYFHQAVEGVGMGESTLSPRLGTRHSVLLCALFASTTSLGGVIGLVSERASRGAPTPNSLIAQGVFGCIAGGILIYMALVSFMVTLIRTDDMHDRRRTRSRSTTATAVAQSGDGAHGHAPVHEEDIPAAGMRVVMYLSMLCGAAAMAVIKIWA